MKLRIHTRLLLILGLCLAGICSAADWQLALPGWRYEFPRDHFIHSAFKTEWWYFTGHLADASGRRFGYQLTFFRQGLRAPSDRHGETSRFLVNDLKFAHFAISDVADGKFHFQQKLSRGAFGEAGFTAFSPSATPTVGKPLALAWIDNWRLDWLGGEAFDLQAKTTDGALKLRVTSSKPWAINGENGVSQKADGVGHASHYYSGTRMDSEGELTIGGKSLRVAGESWLDREWATNSLAAGQAGWNWFSIQLDDGTDLMLYQMRRKDGSLDPNSSGAIIAKDGTTQHLKRDDYQLTPEHYWTSPETGAKYPISWRLSIPRLELSLEITTPLQRQELVLRPIAYWEGLIDTAGTHSGTKVRGQGYMELTGYSGALIGLSAEVGE